ncbi:MAG TPA: bifunctional nicotinamide-nucleotide adenylyltransferase/Nudix hydroxylase [Leucothrix mucor]|nr:bifunctional nicotinamide-nucleotide adenylyltransferase/Nudix hydroxylase [Leucothrix mucor]
MLQKPYDYLIFIGRFQPFHLGHQAVVKTALDQSERVIILLGSSYQPSSVRNPWSFVEREQFIQQSFLDEELEHIITAPLRDLYNDANWVKQVEGVVAGIVQGYSVGNSLAPRIGLIGHSKDHSSYYLSLFPQWGAVDVTSFEHLSATPLRDYYFSQAAVPDGLSDSLVNTLQEYLQAPAYAYLKAEYEFLQRYKKSWQRAPYPPIFVTVDALVVQGKYILLIEREGHPGKGLWALPGGFVETYERLEDAVIRELNEETQIKISKGTLQQSICDKAVFDSPYRSARGRTISHAYLFVLADDEGLAEVIGSDDAKCAFWLAIADIDSEKMFEDHAHIIQTVLSRNSLN